MSDAVHAPRPTSSSLTARVVATLTVLTCWVAWLVVDGVGAVSAVTVAGLVPAAMVDADVHRLPNRMVGSAAIAAGATLVLAAVVGEAPAVRDLAVGAGLMAGPLLVVHVAAPASMGFGDVKAAAVLGIGLGAVHPQLALVALFAASALTASAGLLLRRRAVPFGPGLVIGSAMALITAGLVVGPSIGSSLGSVAS